MTISSRKSNHKKAIIQIQLIRRKISFFANNVIVINLFLYRKRICQRFLYNLEKSYCSYIYRYHLNSIPSSSLNYLLSTRFKSSSDIFDFIITFCASKYSSLLLLLLQADSISTNITIIIALTYFSVNIPIILV